MRRRIFLLLPIIVVLLGGICGWYLFLQGRLGLFKGSPAEYEYTNSKQLSSVFPVKGAKREPYQIHQFSRLKAKTIDDTAAGEGILEGLVLSWETNLPIDGAELTFARGERVSSTMTNFEGVFSFRASQAGTYQLVTVAADGFLPFAPEWGHSPIQLEARPGRKISNIIIHLRTATEYVGTVINQDGQPLRGAEVRVQSALQSDSALAPIEEQFQTDEAGQFIFTGPLGTVVEARYEGYTPKRVRIDQRVQYQKRMTIQLQLGQTTDGSNASIRGIVVDSEHRPIEGALVRGRFMGRRPGGHGIASQALTNEDGSFLLEGLDIGRYFLSATANGWSPTRLPGVLVGQENVRLVLHQGGVLRGVVRDSKTDSPVPSFSVVVEVSRGPLYRRVYRQEAFFDSQGRYEISGLESGSYVAHATSHGYAPSREELFEISSGEQEVLSHFALKQGGHAQGRVVDSKNGQPVVNAQVSIESSDLNQTGPVPTTARTVTNDMGHFEIHGLTPGRRSLIVSAQGYNRRIISGIDVEDEALLESLKIELTPTKDGENPKLELTGIGVILRPRGNGLVIVRVIAGGGASEVGLRRGDVILEVQGQPAEEIGLSGTIEQIRGPEGTDVSLLVQRAATGEQVEIRVPRRHVRTS